MILFNQKPYFKCFSYAIVEINGGEIILAYKNVDDKNMKMNDVTSLIAKCHKKMNKNEIIGIAQVEKNC